MATEDDKDLRGTLFEYVVATKAGAHHTVFGGIVTYEDRWAWIIRFEENGDEVETGVFFEPDSITLRKEVKRDGE